MGIFDERFRLPGRRLRECRERSRRSKRTSTLEYLVFWAAHEGFDGEGLEVGGRSRTCSEMHDVGGRQGSLARID